MYKGIATLSNGQTIEITGTIDECAVWADNLIRENGDQITIKITNERD